MAHLAVQVSSAVLTQVLSPDWDQDGCPLPTTSLKYFLKVDLSVTNLGGSEFSPAPFTVRSVNCRSSDAVAGFFQLSFPGGPYFKDAVCLADSTHSCHRMGLAANGGAYTSTVYFHLKNSTAVQTYPGPTYPAVVTAVAEGIWSDPSAAVLVSRFVIRLFLLFVNMVYLKSSTIVCLFIIQGWRVACMNESIIIKG